MHHGSLGYIFYVNLISARASLKHGLMSSSVFEVSHWPDSGNLPAYFCRAKSPLGCAQLVHGCA